MEISKLTKKNVISINFISNHLVYENIKEKQKERERERERKKERETERKRER